MSDPALVAPTAQLPPRANGASLASVLKSANTHFVGVTGIRTVYVAVAARIATEIADIHLPGTAAVRIALDNISVYLVAPVLAGATAAYYGRPKTVAPTDEKQVAIAEATGQPRSMTPAQP